MVNVIGIRFQQNGKMYLYDAGELQASVGEYVVVETSRGLDLGEVMVTNRPLEDDEPNPELPRVIRVATDQDIQHATDNRAREREAFQICQKKIAEHRLEMKLVSVESMFDNSKLLFYFTANGRVDFRGLVKDLASVFKTRIELRQIGVRDEARMLGGLGPCGRPICCGAFLKDFQPVSIKMAKEQNLSLNPTKISGVCGRLMCCLKYEQDQYECIRKKMPRVGKEVATPDGIGIVTEINVIRETVSVRISSGDASEIKQYAIDQVSRPGQAGAQQTSQKDAGEPVEIPEAEVAAERDNADMLTLAHQPEEERSASRAEKSKARSGVENGFARPERKNRVKNNERDKKIGEKDRPDKGRPGKDKVEKTRDGRDKNNKDSLLGQPVRRENPDKEKQSAAKPNLDQSRQAPVPAAFPKAKKSGGWADAVAKALEAAEPRAQSGEEQSS